MRFINQTHVIIDPIHRLPQMQVCKDTFEIDEPTTEKQQETSKMLVLKWSHLLNSKNANGLNGRGLRARWRRK